MAFSHSVYFLSCLVRFWMGLYCSVVFSMNTMMCAEIEPLSLPINLSPRWWFRYDCIHLTHLWDCAIEITPVICAITVQQKACVWLWYYLHSTPSVVVVLLSMQYFQSCVSGKTGTSTTVLISVTQLSEIVCCTGMSVFEAALSPWWLLPVSLTLVLNVHCTSTPMSWNAARSGAL